MQWSYQHQYEPDRVVRVICNVLNTENSKHVAGRLPQRSHCYDPTVTFAVDDGLDDVRGESEAEEDGVEVCGPRVRAETWPGSVWIRLSWTASHRR